MLKQRDECRTDKRLAVLPKMLEAALEGNRQRVELITITAIRSLKSEFPGVAADLSQILSDFTRGAHSLRSTLVEPPPTDADAGLSLLRMHPADQSPQPVLASTVFEYVARFIQERNQSKQLLQAGFAPPRTILLRGLPGTGKTMLAHWLANQLGLRLVALDLATSISSFLGKTGSNLRRSLDYARANPCVMLLDEFDAIGKRRDDDTELGELKRIVNVLLKELEEWPMHSVLVAATNHPELLDPAINRRFDIVIDVPLPGETEREIILSQSCGTFASELPKGFVHAAAKILEGKNGSELDTLVKTAVRRRVVEGMPLAKSILDGMIQHLPQDPEKKEAAGIINFIHAHTDYTVREIGALFGKSASTIQYHLNKGKKDAESK
jgi:hypothetical protein